MFSQQEAVPVMYVRSRQSIEANLGDISREGSMPNAIIANVPPSPVLAGPDRRRLVIAYHSKANMSGQCTSPTRDARMTN